MRKTLILLAVAVASSVTTALLLGQQGSATPPPQEPARGVARPTGRTLDDVRRDHMTNAGSAAAVASASKPPRIVDADVFAVTDRQGNVRAELSADAGPNMRMFDAHGKIRMVLAETSGTATVTLLDDEGNAGLELRLAPDGDATVALGPMTVKSAAPLTLHVGPKDAPRIALRTSTGEETLTLSSHADEGGMVEVHRGDSGGSLSSSAVSVWSAKGGARASLALPNGNRAQLNMSRGGNTKSELELGCATEGSWLTLNTENLGSADLRATDVGSRLTLKPRGGEGGLHALTQAENGKTTTRLQLSDIDAVQKVQIDVIDGKPSVRYLEADGKPAVLGLP